MAGEGPRSLRIDSVRDAFLRGADVVVDAVSDPLVAARWDEASSLEHQSIGALAAHLARGGVWVVGDYLDADAPTAGPDIDTSVRYVVQVGDALSPEDHAAIRARGAAVAADGPARVAERAARRCLC